MGYPVSFIRWIKTMYSVAGRSILNVLEGAGVISEIQSIRPGCPLSKHLFILSFYFVFSIFYTETLLVRLRPHMFFGIRLIDQNRQSLCQQRHKISVK